MGDSARMSFTNSPPRSAAAGPAVDVRRLEQAVLLMHFADRWVDRILDGDVLGLTATEKALLRPLDRRGFGTDAERTARAARAIIEELPVAVAVAGLPTLLAFFVDDAFVDVITKGEPLVLAAARFLANEPARLEGTIARARRRKHVPRADVVVAAHVASTLATTGALERYSEARARIGADAVSLVGGGMRLSWPVAASDATGVLVSGPPASPLLGGCAAALVRLLGRLEGGLDHQSFIAAARHEGCDDDDEARALLDELVADGLLLRR